MNVPASVLREVEEIIPGFDSPSIVPLASGQMVAVHSVVDASDVWSVLPRLKAAGASGSSSSRSSSSCHDGADEKHRNSRPDPGRPE